MMGTGTGRPPKRFQVPDVFVERRSLYFLAPFEDEPVDGILRDLFGITFTCDAFEVTQGQCCLIKGSIDNASNLFALSVLFGHLLPVGRDCSGENI